MNQERFNGDLNFTLAIIKYFSYFLLSKRFDNKKNWLYSASPKGAHASAFMYSLVESAKANELEPKAYLQALFERYPFAKTQEERRQLLPMFIELS